jgi:hypothetical protein
MNPHTIKPMIRWLRPIAAISIFSTLAMAAPLPNRAPIPFKVPAGLPDVAEALSPSAVEIDGWLGNRLEANAINRLLLVDSGPLLAGFRQKPGIHPWIGEHVGKWLHAATLAWSYTGEARLRAKLDEVAAALVACQEPDGYLGTYVPEKRFGLFEGADWDVWSHKYNLMGLLTYHQYSGNTAALEACRRMGDLLIRTFGPGKKSILSAGTHVGMAATSVLEPMVLLYRFTGDERYVGFARYLVDSWDEPKGPKIVATLLAEKQVNKTANAKAYEMLSNLVGLCELARATGEREWLTPVLIAWEDIVAKRLYLTGSASQAEHFREDYELPNQESAHVAETCVTTTWIQLNAQLVRLMGDSRYADELERTIYNHLAAAQRPDGAQWCYFTPLDGRKPYGPGINCCVSSGPRGMSLASQQAYYRIHADGVDGLAVSTFESSRATVNLNGVEVTASQQSGFPVRGSSSLTLRMKTAARFALHVRAPAWASPVQIVLAGQPAVTTIRYGWLTLPAREWKDGDRVELDFNLGGRVVEGTHHNAGLAALTWGPFVLACDSARNPGLPFPRRLGWAEFGKPPLALQTADPSVELVFATRAISARDPRPVAVNLVPFAAAGRDGGTYRVWLPAPGTKLVQDESLLADGLETRSRQGNQPGSIIDGDPGSIVVTFDSRFAVEDWYAVTLPQPMTIARVVFHHGRDFHDGGWFDAAAGRPRVQLQRESGGTWETVGELADYPPTTATGKASLKSGQPFVLRLRSPVKAVGVRVIGKPASGDNPHQAFSSCGELQAFDER